MDENTLYAARDPFGVRPLSLGRLDRGWVVASETAALDIVGASFVRDIEPGELLAIDADGVRSAGSRNPTPKGCVFEYVYLARPDSTLAGRSVHGARVDIGRRLAREKPVEADLVIGVPESGTPAAVGYAQESGIPFGQGLMKNAYVGRTFIQPSQTIRQLGIRLKLNPLKEVIRGKRLIVVDDSIVRGNTQRALIRMLREAGAVEVHVRIASPPVKWPCFYGIDFATPAELIANAVAERGRDARGGAPRHRRRQPGLHLPAGHDRRDRTAGHPAVLRLLRRQLPDRTARRERSWARTSSSTCWPPRLGPACRLHRHGRQRQRLGAAPALTCGPRRRVTRRTRASESDGLNGPSGEPVHPAQQSARIEDRPLFVAAAVALRGDPHLQPALTGAAVLGAQLEHAARFVFLDLPSVGDAALDGLPQLLRAGTLCRERVSV